MHLWQISRKVLVRGQQVAEGEVLLILEAMKMETEIRRRYLRNCTGYKSERKAGDTVAVGDLINFSVIGD